MKLLWIQIQLEYQIYRNLWLRLRVAYNEWRRATEHRRTR